MLRPYPSRAPRTPTGRRSTAEDRQRYPLPKWLRRLEAAQRARGRNAMRRLGARNRSLLVTLAILRNEIELGDIGA